MITKSMQKKIEQLLDKDSIKTLKESFEKASNKEALRVSYNKENNLIKVDDLTKILEVNDIIRFEERGFLKKAVCTAKGRNGITARDSKGEKIKIRYSKILDWKKR